MKNIYSFLVILFSTTIVFAQAPQKMSYQAVVRNSSGALITSLPIGMQISILQGSLSGQPVYVETQNRSTNSNGLVSLEIGMGTALFGSFSGINWAAGPYFIKTETDPTGGTNYTITGTSELTSVPYALFSANGPTGTLPDGTAPGQMLYWNGTDWVTVAPGIPGLNGSQAQTLTFCNGVPTWGPCPVALPTVSTTTISGITGITATSGGTISNDGGAAVTARGVCWNTSGNPTITNNITNDNSGTGFFNSSLKYLIPNTTYYVRAYATNSAGTSYGNQVSFVTGDWILAVGYPYQGGIIAYVDATGLHGLIAAPSDQSTSIYWHSSDTGITGATGTGIGTGNTNTNAIVAFYGTEVNAAKICYDLDLGGYTDWFLPSKDELNILYSNQVLIGGFIWNAHWSSSEWAVNGAWCKYFNASGNSFPSQKSAVMAVRAVRVF